MTLKNLVYSGLLTASVCLGVASPVLAENVIYLHALGVKGDVQDKTFLGDIRLTSYSQAFTSGGNVAPATCGAITIQKPVDDTSEFFLSRALVGDTISAATVNFVHAAGTSGETAPYSIQLTELKVISINQGDNSGTTGAGLGVQETITLTARTFQFLYSSTNANGSQGRPAVFGWDCGRNAPF